MVENSNSITDRSGTLGYGATAGFVPEIPRRTYTIPGMSSSSARRRPDMPIAENCLAVGCGVHLTGTIESCDSLIVEGFVEADVDDCQSFELTELGRYSGKIKANIAVVDGTFEGTLTVTERLSVRSTGRITGVVWFNGIEIEPGGRIDGEMRPLSAGAEAAVVTP